jgi:nitrogenase molybdenum-iron protein alpha/beta subunit
MPCSVEIGIVKERKKEGRRRMELKGKKVIVIGERDGVQGPAIEACVKSAGAEPVLIQTQCFV